MLTEHSVEIDAPADVVWEVYADVEQWPEWTASVDKVVAVDGSGLAVGKRFAIKQPRFPKLVWEVTTLDAGTTWTWRQHSPGGTTLASHEVVAQGPDRTLVRQRIDQRGPLGVMVGALSRRLTRRYLRMEADGLKARCEDALRRNGAST
jgi:uncharacterized membrane protein